MSIMNFFTAEMNRKFSVFPKKTGLDGGRPAQGFETTATLSDVVCAYYEGGAAEALIADRYKTSLTATIVTYPNVSVPDGAKIVLDNGVEHICIHADDVMTQGEVLVIALTEPDNG